MKNHPNACGATHVGKMRKVNQDSLLVKSGGFATLPNLFIVADGLGGHNAGDIASAGAVQAFCDFLERAEGGIPHEHLMANAITHANSIIYEKAGSNPDFKGMGTTFTSAVISDGILHYAHVGDSRIYIVNDGVLTQITKDHAAGTIEMVADGLITAREAKGYPEKVLIRAVGTDCDVEVDTGKVDLLGVTHILLCSDGLTNMVFENQILEIIQANVDIENKVNELIDSANGAGGADNITVILMEL